MLFFCQNTNKEVVSLLKHISIHYDCQLSMGVLPSTVWKVRKREFATVLYTKQVLGSLDD